MARLSGFLQHSERQQDEDPLNYHDPAGELQELRSNIRISRNSSEVGIFNVLTKSK